MIPAPSTTRGNTRRDGFFASSGSERERVAARMQTSSCMTWFIFIIFFKCDAVNEIQRGREKKGPTVFLYGQVGICAISSDALLMFPLM